MNEENIRFIDWCGDDRFVIIKRAREHIIDATNIESSPEEMKVLNNFLFRCWQMGWLKNDFHQLEKENAELKEQNTSFSTQLIACNERCKDLEVENAELKGRNKMTDEEKAEKYAMQYSCSAINDGCIAVYKGVLVGLAEGRKEGYEQGKNNERESQCGKKNCEKDIARLKIENEQLKQSKNALTIQYEQDIAELNKACMETVQNWQKENEELEWQLKEVIEDNDYYQKKNEELENQIEKMKCCGNCKYRNNYNFPTLEEPCKKCLNYSKWELSE